MTCTWQYPASINADTARLCGNEGSPFCKEHQFIAEVLEETEAVTREIYQQRETALTQWQAQLHRFRLLVVQAGVFTSSAFVKKVHEALPELGRAAMRALIYIYISNTPKVD
jgi:hypothetical protein